MNKSYLNQGPINLWLRLLAIPLFTIYYLVFSSGAHAQEPTKNQLSLGIYPPILEINADPPANIEANIHIQNLSESQVTLEPVYKPFKMAENGDGSLKYTDENLGSIFQEIELPVGENGTLSLEPFESRNLTLKIKLDNHVPIGDYYFSVILISKSSEAQDASAALISGGVGANVILSIGKKGPSSGEIKEFSVPPILEAGPVPITLLLQNKSNHYVVPTGRIIIKDMFGREAGQINILPQYILANSARFMVDTDQSSPSAALEEQIERLPREHGILIWPQKFLFGLYTVEAHIKLSESGPIFESKTYFFAIPIFALFLVSLISFVLLGVYSRIKKQM